MLQHWKVSILNNTEVWRISLLIFLFRAIKKMTHCAVCLSLLAFFGKPVLETFITLQRSMSGSQSFVCSENSASADSKDPLLILYKSSVLEPVQPPDNNGILP